MEQNKENVTEVKEEMTRGKAERKTADEIKKTDTENFATEIFHEFKIHSRIAIICLSALLAIGALLYYKNDVDWRELFNSYDYVTQDGGGYNNVNTGTQGDVSNGAEGEVEEE